MPESFPPTDRAVAVDVEVGSPAPDPDFWGPPRRPAAPPRPGARRRPVLPEGLSARLADWRADGRIGLVILVVVALGAGFVFYRVGLGSGDASASPAPARVASTTPGRRATRAADPPTSTTAATGPAAAKPGNGAKASGARVVVHVAGAVTTPGVVELAAGTRVIDAIEAAGGGLPNADLDRLNLAAKLVDGERILVQHVGDPPAPADATGVSDGAAGTTAAGPLNLNTATEAELEQLPGIGPSLAQAILAARTRTGGFRSVNELREVRGIGERRFADLKSLVTV